MTTQELRTWRKTLHLTQSQAGKLLGGLTNGTICRMEKGAMRIGGEIALLCWLLTNTGVRAGVIKHLGITLPGNLVDK